MANPLIARMQKYGLPKGVNDPSLAVAWAIGCGLLYRKRITRGGPGSGPQGGGGSDGESQLGKGKKALKKEGLIEADNLISAQEFRDDAIIDQKIADGDFDVQISPPFEVDGESYQVIIDGHHSYDAAIKAGVKPNFTVQDASDNDLVGKLDGGDVNGFLEGQKNDTDYYNIETKGMVW